MGDWVAHPSSTASRKILVINSLLVAVSGEGSPKPPGIRKNKPTESLLQLFRHVWASFCFPSSSKRDFLRDIAYLIMKNKQKASKIDDLRARSICV
jgi:hypothetical protein